MKIVMVLLTLVSLGCTLIQIPFFPNLINVLAFFLCLGMTTWTAYNTIRVLVDF